MTEKLSLKWNDFQEHVNTAFANLRDGKEFTDVTLVCADGKQADAHKLILSASSPFFKGVLSRNKHPHPLIFIRGMEPEDLMAILDFIYFGEATVFEHNLPRVLCTCSHRRGMRRERSSSVSSCASAQSCRGQGLAYIALAI